VDPASASWAWRPRTSPSRNRQRPPTAARRAPGRGGTGRGALLERHRGRPGARRDERRRHPRPLERRPRGPRHRSRAPRRPDGHAHVRRGVRGLDPRVGAGDVRQERVHPGSRDRRTGLRGVRARGLLRRLRGRRRRLRA
jgi:hypothetical protein